MIDTTAEKLARREALLTLYRECSLNPEQEQSFEDAFLSGADSDAEAADAEDSMARRLNTYHELFLDEPDAGKWGNPATLASRRKNCSLPFRWNGSMPRCTS